MSVLMKRTCDSRCAENIRIGHLFHSTLSLYLYMCVCTYINISININEGENRDFDFLEIK